MTILLLSVALSVKKKKLLISSDVESYVRAAAVARIIGHHKLIKKYRNS